MVNPSIERSRSLCCEKSLKIIRDNFHLDIGVVGGFVWIYLRSIALVGLVSSRFSKHLTIRIEKTSNHLMFNLFKCLNGVDDDEDEDDGLNVWVKRVRDRLLRMHIYCGYDGADLMRGCGGKQAINHYGYSLIGAKTEKQME